jgi:hypothetical protein
MGDTEYLIPDAWGAELERLNAERERRLDAWAERVGAREAGRVDESRAVGSDDECARS